MGRVQFFIPLPGPPPRRRHFNLGWRPSISLDGAGGTTPVFTRLGHSLGGVETGMDDLSCVGAVAPGCIPDWSGAGPG